MEGLRVVEFPNLICLDSQEQEKYTLGMENHTTNTNCRLFSTIIIFCIVAITDRFKNKEV